MIRSVEGNILRLNVSHNSMVLCQKINMSHQLQLEVKHAHLLPRQTSGFEWIQEIEKIRAGIRKNGIHTAD